MLMRTLFAALLALGLAAAPSLSRADCPAPAAPTAVTAHEPGDSRYFGLSSNTVMAIAGGTAAVAAGTVAAVYAFGAANVLAVAGTLWAAHFVVEAAVLAGAGALGYNVFGDDHEPVRPVALTQH